MTVAALVGDGVHQGISGGERRRLSVGVILMGEPLLLLADEPTTGLDASQSAHVVQLLRNLAIERQVPVVASLHQPRSSIWGLLDDLLLLGPAGVVIYHGAGGDAALSYFETLGYECPGQTNPAEFLIDLVSVDHDAPDGGEADKQRVRRLASAFKQRVRESGESDASVKRSGTTVDPVQRSRRVHASQPQRARVGSRMLTLLCRCWRQSVRNHQLNAVRLGVSSLLASLMGEFFGRFSSTPTAISVAERITCLSFSSVTMAMVSLVKSITSISSERLVVAKEVEQRLYTSAEYLVAKLVTELPFDAAFAGVFG
ncbi:MAG: ABC transporter permease, partial [Candidatus Limnocylindrus sp.]